MLKGLSREVGKGVVEGGWEGFFLKGCCEGELKGGCGAGHGV